MSIHDERDLRARLGAALDDFPAGQFPAQSVVRKGRAMRLRRNVTAVAAGAAVLAAAIATVTLAWQPSQPPAPAVPRHYHVTVNPQRHGSPRGLIASGTLDGRHWQVTARWQRSGGNRDVCFDAGASSCVQGGPGRSSHGGSPAALFAAIGSKPQFNIGTVRADVAYLRITLSNGQLLRLRPVPVFGRQYTSYVAFAVPAAAAVIQVSAYSSHGELGYAVPFTALGSVQPVRWLRPGQQALPRPATYTIGSGTADGVAWAEHFYVGPWGGCIGGAGDGSDCWSSRSRVARAHGAGVIAYSSGNGGTDYLTIDAAPSVSYLLVRRADGSTTREATVRAGGARFCVIASVKGNRAIRWTAYSADGTRVASGSVSGS